MASVRRNKNGKQNHFEEEEKNSEKSQKSNYYSVKLYEYV